MMIGRPEELDGQYIVTDWVPPGFIDELKQMSVYDLLETLSVPKILSWSNLLADSKVVAAENKHFDLNIIKWRARKELELHNCIKMATFLTLEEKGVVDELMEYAQWCKRVWIDMGECEDIDEVDYLKQIVDWFTEIRFGV